MTDTTTTAAAQDVQVATKTEVTLTFDMTDGTQKTVTFAVPNGADGATIQSATPNTKQITNADGSTATEVTLVLGMSDGTTVTVPGFDVPNGKDGSDAVVTEKTVLATTANPTATLGAVTDAALAAIPESEKGAANGVQQLDANKAIAALTEGADASGNIIITGDGTAIVSINDSGSVVETTLGALLASLLSTNVATSTSLADVLKKTSELSDDGSSYSGSVTGDVSKAATGSSDYSTVLDVANAVGGLAQVVTEVNNTKGFKQGDISTSGKSISLKLAPSGLQFVLAYASAGNGTLSVVATGDTVTPVDIYETAIWGSGSTKTNTLDGVSVTTTPTVVDSQIYLSSNAAATYHVGVAGGLYIVDVFSGGAGARAVMSYRKVA